MNKKLLFATALIVALTVIRLLPHDVNFTPVLAVALLSGFLFSHKFAWAPVLISMLAVDFILGFHSTSLFVYGSVLLISLMSLTLKGSKSFVLKSVAMTASAGIVFFLITNFGVWMMTPLYEKTYSGLIQAYVAGLPFLKNTLLSTFMYFYIAVGAYKLFELKSSKVKIV